MYIYLQCKKIQIVDGLNSKKYLIMKTNGLFGDIKISKVWIFIYLKYIYLNIWSIDIKISGLGIFKYLGKVDIWISALTR